MSGRPEWQIVKASADGVIVPWMRWCGVRACELRNSWLGLLSVRTTCFSNRDGSCRGSEIEPIVEAPRVVLERFGGGAGPRRADTGGGGAGKQDASPEQGAAVEQPVAGNGRQRIRRRSDVTLGNAHECLPRANGRLSRPVRRFPASGEILLPSGSDVQIVAMDLFCEPALASGRTARTSAPAPTSRWRSATSSAQMSGRSRASRWRPPIARSLPAGAASLGR